MIQGMEPAGVFVLAALLAVAGRIIAQHLRLPAIVPWLLSGMALGPFGLHWIQVEHLRPALHALIELGLAVILFEGGLNLDLRALKRQGRIVAGLLLLGPAATMLIGGLLLHLWGGADWRMALLFGALVSVGGPTVIAPIVRQTRMDRTLRHVLTGEAMLVDALGAMLAIVMLQLTLAGGGIPTAVVDLGVKFAVGTAAGWIGGRLLGQALARDWMRDAELRSIATLAAVWGIYLLADHVSRQAGLLAVLVAGAVLQHKDLPDIQRLRHFKGALSMLLVSVLFVLLAANLNLDVLISHLPLAFGIFAALALLARPLAVALAAWGTDLSAGQRGYLALMAPRGVVAAAITSLFGLVLTEHGVPGGELLEPMVYGVIVLSVVGYGLMAAPLARWLGVEGSDERSVLIVGGGQIGAELGRALGEDREVRFLDTNAEVIAQLQRSGHMAVRGNALDPLFMEVVHAEEMGVIVVMTGSSEHNLLIAQLARDQFHVHDIFVALREGDEERHASMIHRLGAKRLFAKHYNFTYWNDQALRKRLTHERLRESEDTPL